MQAFWGLTMLATHHCDEEANARVQADGAAISEDKGLLALTNGTEDAVYLQAAHMHSSWFASMHGVAPIA